MSQSAKARAKKVAALPAVRAWTARLRELAHDMPPEVHVFVASGTVCVVALDEGGSIYEHRVNGGLDQDATVETVGRHLGRWDGGDW